MPLNCLFQVYYVNPQKKWGLRTLNFIKKGSILFEYGGILSEDKDGIEDDDYIYLFDYVSFTATDSTGQLPTLFRYTDESPQHFFAFHKNAHNGQTFKL